MFCVDTGVLLKLVWEDKLSFLAQLKLCETLFWFMTIGDKSSVIFVSSLLWCIKYFPQRFYKVNK